MATDSDWVCVASLAEFNVKRRLVIDLDGTSILLCRSGNDIVAVSNACTHLGKPLDGGRIMAGHIHCPFHGACFSLATGEAVSGPAVAPLHRYGVKIDGAHIFICRADKPSPRLPLHANRSD